MAYPPNQVPSHQISSIAHFVGNFAPIEFLLNALAHFQPLYFPITLRPLKPCYWRLDILFEELRLVCETRGVTLCDPF